MIIMHIDVNSAYLSWTAVDLLRSGYEVDIREVPSVIAGNPENRHGIVLAKSIPAKKFGIKTGESLYEANKKCTGLLIFPPDYDLYIKCSIEMYKLLSEYSPIIERYSIDECYMDYTASVRNSEDVIKTAHLIKNRIKNELGYTVNIGVSCNKILAKMGSDFMKPDKVHTLFPEEIEKKMWGLPVEDLFMVGKNTAYKLRKVNIRTIGDLANSNVFFLRNLLKSQGEMLWNYANGRDFSKVVINDDIEQKSIGNSMTLRYDIITLKEVRMFLLLISDHVGRRLRKKGFLTGMISLSVKNSDFQKYSRQMKLYEATDLTIDIYKYACKLFEESWNGKAVRLLGISVGSLKKRDEPQQLSIFSTPEKEKSQALDRTIDNIREKYGEKSIMRGIFVNNSVNNNHMKIDADY